MNEPFKKSSQIWLESVDKRAAATTAEQKWWNKTWMSFSAKINRLSIDLFHYDYKDVLNHVQR